MGKKSGRKLSAELREEFKARGRKKYLVKKERAGTLAGDEVTELEALRERFPGTMGRPSDPQVEAVDKEDAAPQDEGAIAPEGAADPAPDASAAPPPPPRVKVEPPPRVTPPLTSSWRDKYKQSVPAASREGSCCEVAALICGGLKRANAEIVKHGHTPIFADEVVDKTLFPAWVLVVDKFMPDVELGVEWVAAGMSATIIGQAFAAARKAKAAKPPLKSIPFARATDPAPKEAEIPMPPNVRSPEEPPAPPAPPTTNGHGEDYLA